MLTPTPRTAPPAHGTPLRPTRLWGRIRDIVPHARAPALERMVQPQPMPEFMHHRPSVIVIGVVSPGEGGVADQQTVFERGAQVR